LLNILTQYKHDFSRLFFSLLKNDYIIYEPIYDHFLDWLRGAKEITWVDIVIKVDNIEVDIIADEELRNRFFEDLAHQLEENEEMGIPALFYWDVIEYLLYTGRQRIALDIVLYSSPPKSDYKTQTAPIPNPLLENLSQYITNNPETIVKILVSGLGTYSAVHLLHYLSEHHYSVFRKYREEQQEKVDEFWRKIIRKYNYLPLVLMKALIYDLLYNVDNKVKFTSETFEILKKSFPDYIRYTATENKNHPQLLLYSLLQTYYALNKINGFGPKTINKIFKRGIAQTSILQKKYRTSAFIDKRETTLPDLPTPLNEFRLQTWLQKVLTVDFLPESDIHTEDVVL
jgi:hypothetical protein